MQELLAECSVFQGRLPKTISFKGLQQRLDSVQTAVQLCQEMLGIEGAVSLLGSGPRGIPLVPLSPLPPNPCSPSPPLSPPATPLPPPPFLCHEVLGIEGAVLLLGSGSTDIPLVPPHPILLLTTLSCALPPPPPSSHPLVLRQEVLSTAVAVVLLGFGLGGTSLSLFSPAPRPPPPSLRPSPCPFCVVPRDAGH